MQFRSGIFVVTEEHACPLYNVGDEFRVRDMTLNITRNKPACLSMLTELIALTAEGMPQPAVRPVRGRPQRGPGKSECGGCEGLIRFELKKTGEFATVQMRLLAAAERQATLFKSDNGFVVLRELPAFAELDDNELHAFCAGGQPQHFEPGERVISRGELADRIFIMLAGRVILSDEDQGEDEEHVVEVAPGELIGELGLVADTVYPNDYYCLEQASLLMMTVPQVKAFLVKMPALHVFFYHQLARRVEKLGPANMEVTGGLNASLKEIAVVDLCQLINSSRKTGRVLLALEDDTKGELLFNEGELIGAKHEALSGKDAFFELLGRNGGTFNFVAGLNEAEMEHPVIGGFMGLVMEGMQKLDEQNDELRRQG